MKQKSYFIGSSMIATFVIFAYFGASHFLNKLDHMTECNTNLDPVVRQCLPEELNEKSMFMLRKEDKRLILECEKHREQNYGQPIKQPSVRYVLALKDEQ